MAADSTMLRMVKRLIALSLGVHRLQLEQRMGLTWPRPFLLRPLKNHHQHLVPQLAIYLESACAPVFLSSFRWFVHSLIPYPPLPHTMQFQAKNVDITPGRMLVLRDRSC